MLWMLLMTSFNGSAKSVIYHGNERQVPLYLQEWFSHEMYWSKTTRWLLIKICYECLNDLKKEIKNALPETRMTWSMFEGGNECHFKIFEQTVGRFAATDVKICSYSGLVQKRRFTFTPPPHDLEHSLKVVSQSDHPPLIGPGEPGPIVTQRPWIHHCLQSIDEIQHITYFWLYRPNTPV